MISSNLYTDRKTVSFLDLEINIVELNDLNFFIYQAIREKSKKIIANHNLHSVYILLVEKDMKMKEFYKLAHITHADGMSLVLLAKLFGQPLERKHRIAYLDWLNPLLKEVERNNWRLFYLGGKPGVAKRAAEKLRLRFPRLKIQTHHGYFKNSENKNIIEKINSYNPHILMVGMGMPKQEHWIVENFSKIKANVFLPCGACFDYIAEVIPTPPRWLGFIGLEWLYRLLSEPRRLAPRYLKEPLLLIGFLTKEWLRRVVKKTLIRN